MALQAKKWFPCIEKIAVDRTVGCVTIQAILCHISMRVEIGPPLFRVTLDTGLLDGILRQVCPGKTTVRIVTVHAKYPTFFQRMVARQGKFHLGTLMAGKTELARGQRRHFQIRAGMDIVAVETGNFVQGMDTGIPIMQVKGGIGRVTLETDQGLGRGGQIFQVYERLEIARGFDTLSGIIFNQFRGQVFYGQAAGTMAGLAVHQGHP
jgi:hypothetical protein